MFRGAIKLAILLLFFHHGHFKAVANQRVPGGDEVEMLEDCNSEQFYYYPQSRCRNCSDISQLLNNYQEWLGHETIISNRRKAVVIGGQDKNNINKLSVNGNNYNNNNGGPRFNENDAVLSRLISVDPQDQLYVDSNQDSSGDSGSIESSDFADNIGAPTRQTQSLVSRFIQSNFIGNELLSTIDQCRQYRNVSACQMWSNLCVMTMYSYSDTLPASHSSSSSSSYDSAKANYEDLNHSKRTWQKCRQFTVSSICNSLRDWFRTERKSSLDILDIYAIDESLAKIGPGLTFRLDQALQFLAYKYAYNGKLIGVDQFGLNEMEKFCVISDTSRAIHHPDDVYIRLGKNLLFKCQFDSIQASLGVIKNFNETIFVDLYIGYSLNGATFVKPVPILIKNLMFNGIQINRKHSKDSSRWKLVHRFFFQSSLPLGAGKPSDLDEKILLYAKKAVLDLKFKRQERGAQLTSILLTLDYSIIAQPTSNSNSNTTGQLSSASKSRMFMESDILIIQNLLDMQSYKKDLDLIMTILCVLSSIWSFFKCYNIQKCHGTVKLDLDSLLRFIVIGCDAVANLFAAMTLSFLAYLFIALKAQSSVNVLAPDEDLEAALLVNIRLAFVFKSVGLAHKICVQLSADTFFVDWEKPKMLTSCELLNHISLYSQGKEQISKHGDPQDMNQNLKQNLPQPSQQSTSFWRLYTVVNRWLQMQTLRRQNLALQLILFVLLVEIFHLTNLATEDLNLKISEASASNHNNGTQLAARINPAFRLFVLAFFYLSLSMIQIAYKKYFHEPMLRNIVHDFVDLCSVANVSLFSMLHPRYGYYIHGRNANGSGECGIAEMNSLLEREERDLCSKRGLEPNSDQQTFIMILPQIINDHYKKLLSRDNPANSNHLTKSKFNDNKFASTFWRSALNLPLSQTQSSFSKNRTFIESIVGRNRAVNTFLINFLEHVYKDIDYSIRDQRRFESFLFDVDFNDDISGASNGPLAAGGIDKSKAATFCKDNKDSFTSLIWLGSELDLILMELLTLLVLDLWLGQPLVVTSSIVWLLHQIFKRAYVTYARQNLVRKALVDQKFLFR